MFLLRPPTRLVRSTAIATLLLFTPLVISAAISFRAFNRLVTNEFQLQKLSDRVTYLNEVLAMSVRMYAATGDEQWAERYDQHVVELEQTITDSLQLAPEFYKTDDTAAIKAAARQLIAMDAEAFQLVEAGNFEEALDLVLSPEYSRQEDRYSAGVEARQGDIQNRIWAEISVYRQRLILSGVIAGLTLVLLVPAWLVVLRSLKQYLQQLNTTQAELSQSNEELEQRSHELKAERDRSEQLLLNILPSEIAAQLKIDSKPIADHFDEVTILFADIVGFTNMASSVTPLELVERLNRIFSSFDQLTSQYKLEKIKTIGDAYMVVGGLPTARVDHAECVADVALAMQREIARLQMDPDHPIQIRIGINTGAVVAGVIGIHKFIYDLWGDAVNVASRMESSGNPGQIQVTEITYKRLKEKYIFEERGLIDVKGKGSMKTYWLMGKKSDVTIPTKVINS